MSERVPVTTHSQITMGRSNNYVEACAKCGYKIPWEDDARDRHLRKCFSHLMTGVFPSLPIGNIMGDFVDIGRENTVTRQQVLDLLDKILKECLKNVAEIDKKNGMETLSIGAKLLYSEYGIDRLVVQRYMANAIQKEISKEDVLCVSIEAANNIINEVLEGYKSIHACLYVWNDKTQSWDRARKVDLDAYQENKLGILEVKE